jgi:hypothetical protein
LTGSQINPALQLKQIERLADRPTADAEALGQVRFDQMFAGLVDTVDDQSLETIAHPLAQRGVLQQFLAVRFSNGHQCTSPIE